MTTFDVDLWIDLPSRQYIRVLNLCIKLGATIRANTLVVLTDDTAVNFGFRVDGLRSFAYEYKRARKMNWCGQRVSVLPLKRIYKSKKTIRRPKDLGHLVYLEQAMKLQKKVGRS